MRPTITIRPISNIPLVEAGDDLAKLIAGALSQDAGRLEHGDIVVVAQKIVSLAEGRLKRLNEVEVSPAAIRLAQETDKDPRLVELIIQESTAVIRKKPGVIIVRHRLGFVGANAGIDQSNIDHANGDVALLLPEDPDSSAQELRRAFLQETGCRVGVIISDSMNRAWRLGSVGTAIGSSGISVLDDRRGHKDLYGRRLVVTMANRADAIAAAAVLVMGETSERVPAAIVRGFPEEHSTESARDCIRPVADDLFL